MAVAMKDLEIRGAGNVLGAEQSGHVAGVGFDLYVRLVGEAVEAYRAAADGKTVTTAEEPKEVRIDLPVDAHLPPDYIGSDRLRLEAYRRLAAAPDDATVDSVIDELVDRYGPLPEPALRLVAVARLRLLARAYGVTEIGASVGDDAADLAADVAGLGAAAAQAALLRRDTTAPPPPPCRSRCRARAAGSALRGSATWNWSQFVAGLLLAHRRETAARICRL